MLRLRRSAQVKLLFIFKHVQLKSKFQDNETWSTEAWPPSRLCYRPTAFFRHLLLVARITKILLHFVIFKNRVRLKLPFLILPKSNSVCTRRKVLAIPLDPPRIAHNVIRDWTTASTVRCQLEIQILSLVEHISAGDSDIHWASH